MIRAALLTTALFVLLHVLGGREAVGLLSGTMEGGRSGLVLGVLYSLSWFSAVLVAPVLLLAGLAELALHRRIGPPTATSPSSFRG